MLTGSIQPIRSAAADGPKCLNGVVQIFAVAPYVEMLVPGLPPQSPPYRPRLTARVSQLMRLYKQACKAQMLNEILERDRS